MILDFKKIPLFLFIIIILIEFLLFSHIFSYSFLFADDINSVKLYSPENNILSLTYNKMIFSSFLDRFFGVYLPSILNIHPSDFKASYFNYIESFLILFFIFILNNLLFLHKKGIEKIDYLYSLSFITISSLIFYIIQQQHLTLFIYDGFFRMLLPCFVFVLFLGIFVSKIRGQNYNNWGLYVLIFYLSLSNEMICVTTLVSLTLFSIFSFIFKFPKQDNLKLNKYTFVSFVGFLFMFLGGVFFRKSSNVMYNLDYFTNLFNSFFEFIKQYFEYIFLNHICEYIVLIILFLMLKKFVPSSVEKNKIFLVILSFLVGILVFFLSLIVLGETHTIDSKYWLVHVDLHLIYDVILLSFMFIIISTLANYIKLKKLVIFPVLLISFVALTVNNYQHYEYFFNSMLLKKRVETYKAEKIIRLAVKNDKIAYLDKELLKEGYNWAFFPECFNVEENVIYYKSPYLHFLKQIGLKEELTQGYMFVDSKISEEEFINNGGAFTEEELKSIKFTNLLNEKISRHTIL